MKVIRTVLYFGVLASFFGGWVPARAKNVKLVAFHLYLFLSFLILPLIVAYADATGLIGWILYSVFITASFTLIKILNYRLHKALGTEESKESKPKENVPKKTDSPADAFEGRGLEEATEAVVLLEKKDDAMGRGQQHSQSASTLNENEGSSQNTQNDIELSVVSQVENAEVHIGQAASEDALTSPLHRSSMDSDLDETERRTSTGSRQRVCQRGSSRRRRSEEENAVVHVEDVEEDSPGNVPSTRERLVENGRNVLRGRGYISLAEVTDRMSNDLLEVIDVITNENCEALQERITVLRSGHLATHPEEIAPGAIHWLSDNSGWEFYTFDGIDSLEEDVMDPDIVEALENSRTPPVPPPRPSPASDLDNTVVATTNMTPHMNIIPQIARTKVNLTFSRTDLEEYMDRNVSRREVLLTIVLAVLVCVVGALLLTVGTFYRGFWIFWLCFVIATAHFSLIKSVQSDPASPSPGQNRVHALSRALYFIVVGSIALSIDASLRMESFGGQLCVYGFDLNAPSVLRFVRDGLYIFILFLPVLFTLGWMPQFDTFLITVLEQMDMHVFGGTGSTGLVCSVYSVGRSVLAVAVLWPLGYGAFASLSKSTVIVPEDRCSYTFADFVEDVNYDGQCTPGNRAGVSVYVGGVVAVAYVLSRATSNHQYILDLCVCALKYCMGKLKCSSGRGNPLPPDALEEMYRSVTKRRLLSDALTSVMIFIVVSALNFTTVFCQNEIVGYVVFGTTVVVGAVTHYLLPHLRKENTCLCTVEPCIKSQEYNQFEVTETPRVSVLEKLLQLSVLVEKNVLYPLTFLFAIGATIVYYGEKFGEYGAPVFVTVVVMKIFRTTYSDLSKQYVVLALSLLFFQFDYRHLSEGLPLDYFVMAILVDKMYDLYLKVYFIYIYIQPWLGGWSSPFHIFIQPFLVPHCPLIFFETLIGSIVSAPINPVYASTMFMLSYARPVKFWEKNYNTKRRDTTNTRLEQQLEGSLRNPNPDHLDSLFYEQLSWSLQRDLCGDVTLGRWGHVTTGDIFIMSNDTLNAMVHIIEVGNGFVTFQLRGLEFRGTYCHQREREAITEPFDADDGCCRLPGLLTCCQVLSSRWMAWQIVSTSYALQGYSISENQAHLVFNAFEYKRNFITYYVKCIIYRLIKSDHLMPLLSNSELQDSLADLRGEQASDRDVLFDSVCNVDYNGDPSVKGLHKLTFLYHYHDFIRCCAAKHYGTDTMDDSSDSFLVSLCFAFSILGRRMFFTHASAGSGRRGDNFLHGLYRMFIGDARPDFEKDSWVFCDIDSIEDVIIPAARTALKVHQDNFTLSDQYETPDSIYEVISDAEANHLVTHENDRSWREGVIMNRPSLIALRYQRTEDTYINPYKIIRLTSKFIKFRIVKINRECVRSLWSSQQHELIFFRNSDSERGSIQNHKATLRNMVNSSMDLPIGYPIYVSPLQTSFLDRHAPYNNTLAGRISDAVRNAECLRRTKCSRTKEMRLQPKDVPTVNHDDYVDPFGGDSDSDEDFWKPIWVGKQVLVSKADEVFDDSFKVSWLQWPNTEWPSRVNRSPWQRVEGAVAEVLHEWRPFHIAPTSRSHIDKVVLLIQYNENLFLIKEQGVQTIT